MTIYSNPRMNATIENWPNGGGKRCTATFTIEQTNKGERAVRVTTGAPKKLTYARKARIVNGDDGRTYIIELTMYGHISVMQGAMKFEHETLFESNPRYAGTLAMFDFDEKGNLLP